MAGCVAMGKFACARRNGVCGTCCNTCSVLRPCCVGALHADRLFFFLHFLRQVWHREYRAGAPRTTVLCELNTMCGWFPPHYAQDIKVVDQVAANALRQLPEKQLQCEATKAVQLLGGVCDQTWMRKQIVQPAWACVSSSSTEHLCATLQLIGEHGACLNASLLLISFAVSHTLLPLSVACVHRLRCPIYGAVRRGALGTIEARQTPGWQRDQGGGDRRLDHDAEACGTTGLHPAEKRRSCCCSGLAQPTPHRGITCAGSHITCASEILQCYPGTQQGIGRSSKLS